MVIYCNFQCISEIFIEFIKSHIELIWKFNKSRAWKILAKHFKNKLKKQKMMDFVVNANKVLLNLLEIKRIQFNLALCFHVLYKKYSYGNSFFLYKKLFIHSFIFQL